MLVIVAVLAGVQALGLNPTSLLAGVSVFGLAVSFGAQNLVRDVLNGFFFLLEDQFGVGDRITINGKELTGDVERLNLRVTTLRHRQTGAIHIIPNGEIKKVTVERKGRNWNRVEALARVSYDDDLEKALEVFEATCQQLYEDAEWQEAFIEKPIVQGVHELGEYEIYLRALLTVRPTKQGRVRREFNRRIKHAFDEAGLNIAPNRTTTIGNVVQMRLVSDETAGEGSGDLPGHKQKQEDQEK